MATPMAETTPDALCGTDPPRSRPDFRHVALLIENGRVIDPSQKLDRVTNLLVDNGRIAAYDAVPERQRPRHSGRRQDRLAGPDRSACPTPGTGPRRGRNDRKRHRRGRGRRFHFDRLSAQYRAAASIRKPAWSSSVRRRPGPGTVMCWSPACVSKDRAGKELAEIGSLVEAGAVAFTDAPRGIQNAELLRRAFEYCLMFDKPILNHPEVLELSHDGIMHEGTISMVLGLEGLPAEAEDVMTSRDLRLAEATGGRLASAEHLQPQQCGSDPPRQVAGRRRDGGRLHVPTWS